MTTSVQYNYLSDDDLTLRRDPAFYVTDEQAHELVATIVNGDRGIRVFCDGEMRIHVWANEKSREEGTDFDVVRYASDLSEHGITDDLTLEVSQNRIEWINNAWFDLYAYGEGITDGWLDCVQHDVQEAVSQAVSLINDDKVWSNLK